MGGATIWEKGMLRLIQPMDITGMGPIEDFLTQEHTDMVDIMAFIITIWAKEKLRLHPRLMPITDITIIEDTMEAITDIQDTTDTCTTVGKPIKKFNQSEDLTNQKIQPIRKSGLNVSQNINHYSVTFLIQLYPKNSQ